MVGHPTLPSCLSAILYYSSERERGDGKLLHTNNFNFYPLLIPILQIMSKSLGDFKIPKKARVQSVVIVPKASQRETTQNKARDFSSNSHRRSTKFIHSQSWARS